MNGTFDVTIRNFRSIKSAGFSVSNIALITGPNHSGKTAILNGVAACFLGDSKVYDATEKNTCSVVTDGQSQASIALDGHGWDRAISWPGDITGNDVDMTMVNKVTMGYVDPARDFKKAEWAGFVRSIAPSNSKLTFKDVMASIEKQIGSKQEFEDREADYKVLRDALDGGWDAAASLAKSRAIGFKRGYETISAERFGETKAASWQADGYVPTDGVEDVQPLRDACALLRDELAVSRSREDVVVGQREDIESAMNDLQDRQRRCQSRLETLRSSIRKVQTELSYYPSSGPFLCPDCSSKFEMQNGKPVKYQPGAHVYGSQDHNYLISSRDRDKDAYDKAAALNGSLIAKIEAETAMLKKISTFDESVREVGVIDAELQQAERRYKACQATIEARIAFARWKLFSVAGAALGVQGLRFEATKKALASLEPRIEEITGHIFPDYDVAFQASESGVDILFDGRPYKTMTWNNDANTFALGVNILCQLLTLDTWSPDCPIIIDRFDLLEIKRRGLILAFLVKSGRPAIIGQTTSKRLTEDKLAAKGVGKTYFINDGVLEGV